MRLMLSLAQQCLRGDDQELHFKDTMGKKGFDSESWKYRSCGVGTWPSLKANKHSDA